MVAKMLILSYIELTDEYVVTITFSQTDTHI